MNILILNWRDIKNPSRGGAELLTHELAKRLVSSGHQVYQISERFSGSSEKERIDGVTIVRLGKWWSVHLLAFIYYITRLHSKIDIILDEVHWLPFYARLFAPRKTI